MKTPMRPKETIKLLDEFAGKAMQAWIIASGVTTDLKFKDTAENAYELAEFMLEVREEHIREVTADFGGEAQNEAQNGS